MRQRTGCSTRSKAAAPARWMHRATSARGKRQMRNPGTRPSRRTLLASPAILLGACVAIVTLPLPGTALAQALQPFAVVGDTIPASLTGAPGDAARGRALVLNRVSTCILCHSGPFPEEKFQGDLAPNLAGSGSRWTPGQLRLRLVDASRLNPATIMPSYYRIDGLTRVGPAWRGKPILSAEQIEDIVAYLVTLRQ